MGTKKNDSNTQILRAIGVSIFGALSPFSASAQLAGDLNALLAAASPGDVISTKNRDFGDVSLAGYSFDPPVTIKFHKKAAINQLIIRNSSGLKFDGMNMVLGESFSPASDKGVFVLGGGNIAFNDASIEWARDADPLNDGTAMVFDGVDGVSISGGAISHSLSGVVIRSSSNASVRGVQFSELLGDGIVVSGTRDVTIDDNTCTDFAPRGTSGSHPDCIQLQAGSRAVANTNLAITNNMALKGAGSKFQGIFVTSRHVGVPHINVTIENNTVKQDVGNGIAASNIDGLTVRGNQVLPAFDVTDPPRIIVNEPASDVLIEGNTASGITAPPDAIIRDNTILD
ncbi:MAG: right-handed parallel beta-helix repeat-containing protein [Marinicaulis sp.]|nr:right-handed parallel beta-helix repeat-containing protein [Marinicaulis sp.]